MCEKLEKIASVYYRSKDIGSEGGFAGKNIFDQGRGRDFGLD